MKQNDKSKEENDIIKCEYNLYYLLNNFIHSKNHFSMKMKSKVLKKY